MLSRGNSPFHPPVFQEVHNHSMGPGRKSIGPAKIGGGPFLARAGCNPTSDANGEDTYLKLGNGKETPASPGFQRVPEMETLPCLPTGPQI